MWYTADDVMTLLNVGKSKAYEVIRNLGNEISKTKIPGKERCYARPPAGKIQKSYFCEKFMFEQAECDRVLENAKVGNASA